MHDTRRPASLAWQVAIYVPSLLSRYSTQTLVIAMAWLLQQDGIDVADISRALIPFYFGALAFSALASLRVARWNLPWALVAVLLLQAVFSVACLQAQSVVWVAILRFLQGAATGVCRPLAQLWALECATSIDSTPQQKMQVNVFVQVAIAIGTGIGSCIGLVLGHARSGWILAALLIALPALAACLSVWRVRLRLSPRRPASDAPLHEDAPASFRVVAWLSGQPLVLCVFFVFFSSMAAYNIWPIVIPFSVRAVATAELLAMLAVALAVQPLVFGLGQVMVSRWLAGRDVGVSRLVGLLLASHVLSLCLMWLSAVQSQPEWFLLVFLGGTGVLVAAIYPLCSLLLMKGVDLIEPARRQEGQRRLVFLLGLAGDLGQMAGGGLLASRLLPGQPAELFGWLAVLSVPAVSALVRRPRAAVAP